MSNGAPPPEPDHVLKSLEGRWRVVRRVPGMARLKGIAVFAPLRGDRLAYKETGTLELANGHRATAEKEYVFAAAEGGFDVYFAESPLRLFHEARLSPSNVGLIGVCEHLCIADTYMTKYRWLRGDQFSISHRIKGPRKDYRIVTRYKRFDD